MMPELRICIVTNYYPPHFIGGYELGCREVADRLKARGHDVKILTSTYKVNGPREEGNVYRWFDVRPPWEGASRRADKLIVREISNRRIFKRFCDAFDPQLIYVWNPVGISLSIVSLAQKLKIPVCYFVSDHWLSEWERDFGYEMWEYHPARHHRRVAWKTMLVLLHTLGLVPKPEPPDLRNVQFVSRFLKEAALRKGQPVAEAQVIHWGIDIEFLRSREVPKNPLRLLYVGQLMPHKGVHTAIEALKILVKDKGFESATLTIAGTGVDRDYNDRLRQLVSGFGLNENVRFCGLVPRDDLPALYQDHGILILPSVWDEPFSITLLEAMASDLAVVGTPTGGSSEILQDGVNALVFRKEDATKCAEQILRLWQDPKLFEEIRHNAAETIERKFRIDQMVDSIESSLLRVAGNHGY